jgi:hypothetical protein
VRGPNHSQIRRLGFQRLRYTKIAVRAQLSPLVGVVRRIRIPPSPPTAKALIDCDGVPVDIVPAQASNFTDSQAGVDRDVHHRSIGLGDACNQFLKLFFVKKWFLSFPAATVPPACGRSRPDWKLANRISPLSQGRQRVRRGSCRATHAPGRKMPSARNTAARKAGAISDVAPIRGIPRVSLLRQQVEVAVRIRSPSLASLRWRSLAELVTTRESAHRCSVLEGPCELEFRLQRCRRPDT